MSLFKKILLSSALIAVGAFGAWAALDAAQVAFAPTSIHAQACASGFQCSCYLPPTCSLWTNPTSLTGGGDVTLYWSSTNSIGGSLNGLGALPGAAGNVPIYGITNTSTYTATFWNSLNQTVQCSTTITITPPPPPAPTCTLDASPSTINSGGSSTLSWTTTNAASASIDQSGPVSPIAGGSTSVSPSSTTTYTLTAANSAGVKVTCTKTVTVTPPPPPQNGCIQILKETFDPSGNKLTPVAQFTFTLDGGVTVQNDANGNAIFNNVTPGAHQVVETPAGPTWNLLSVTPASGNVTVAPGPTCAAVVFKNEQVVPPSSPPPTCTLDASPSTINSGGSSTLSWTTTNAASASIDQSGPVSPIAGGSTSVSPSSTTTYTLTAANSAGVKVTCTKTVTVTPPPSIPSCTLAASPSSLGTASGSTTLTWTSVNAVSASIDNSVGPVSPVAGGSVSANVSANTTFTLTVTAAGGAQRTCQASVTVTPPPGNTPSCTLSLSASSITTGDSAVLSWTSANVSSGSIDNNVGTTSPVSSGSVTVYPPSSTTYTGTFTGAYGTVSCSIPITVHTGGGGCTTNCGGGGLNQPSVALYQQPNNQPLAFLSLSQIPYTGFEAGPALTLIFWLSVALLSALIAYLIVGGEGMSRYTLAYILGHAAGVPLGHGHIADDRESDYGRSYPVDASVAAPAPAPAAPAAAVASAPVLAPVSSPALSQPTAPVPGIVDVIESRAHAAGVLVSPEAAALAAGFSLDRAEALRIFGDILNDAVHTIPREDGWIMLTADKLRELSAQHPAASVPAALPISSVDESAALAFAGAVVSGDRTSAFSIIRSLEHDGVSPTALMTATATVLDALYRARRDSRPAPNAALADKASHLADAQLEHLVAVFTHALDHVYASPFTGVKLALAQAFEAIG